MAVACDDRGVEFSLGGARGRGDSNTQVDHLFRPASDAPADRRGSEDGARLPGVEPSRVGAHHLRASGLARPERDGQHPVGAGAAGGAGGGRRRHAAEERRDAGGAGAAAKAGPHGPFRGARADRLRPRPAVAAGGGGGGGAVRGGAVERTGGPASLPGLSASGRAASALRHRRPRRPLAGLHAVSVRRPVVAVPRRLRRLGRRRPAPAPAPGSRPQPMADLAVGARGQPGLQGAVAGVAPAGRRLAGAARLPARAGRDLRRSGAVRRRLLPGGELDAAGRDPGQGLGPAAENGLRAAAGKGLPVGPDARARAGAAVARRRARPVGPPSSISGTRSPTRWWR